MKFRCPYCKHEFKGQPLPHCPTCHKTMCIPGQFRKDDVDERKRAKEKIARDAERQRKAMQGPFAGTTRGRRSPITVFMVLFILLGVGALLVGRVGMVFVPEESKQPQRVAERNVNTLRIAVELFKHDCGRYPESEEGLKALIINPGIPGWQRPYVDSIRRDPWKEHYVYAITNSQGTVFSCGPDKLPNTADDVLPNPAEIYATLTQVLGTNQTPSPDRPGTGKQSGSS